MDSGTSQSADAIIERMIGVFDRRVEIPALNSLISALRANGDASSLDGAAIAIDANAVLRASANLSQRG